MDMLLLISLTLKIEKIHILAECSVNFIDVT